MSRSIPSQILQSATGLLAPYFPELTPTKLVKAMKSVQCNSGDRREPLMPKKEAARLLGVSIYTVQRMIHDGKLKGVRLNNGYWKVHPESVYQAMCPTGESNDHE